MRTKSSRVTAVQRKPCFRPRIEPIENRLLLAVITVTSTGDAISATDGKVTLREAITAVNSQRNVSDVVGVGAYGQMTPSTLTSPARAFRRSSRPPPCRRSPLR